MVQYFVPYDIAKELKEIGFDEFCFKYYDQSYDICSALQLVKWNTESKILISAPIYDQVIDWFIKKYDFYIYSFRYKREWGWKIDDDFGILEVSNYKLKFPNRYEALNAGIKKAIELIKQKEV